MNLNAARRLRRCVPDFSIAGWRTQRDSNPQPPTAPTSLSTQWVLYHLRAMRPVILFWSTSWANLTQGWTDTLSLTRGQQVSRSHKPRPPKFKLPGLTRSVTLGAGTRRPRSATTYTVGAGSTAGGANFARLLRRFAAAVVVGLKDGFHPLSAASCGNRKELTPLSSHAFVRSMTWAWYHSRHLPEKLASSTKAFIVITLIIKKCNNILE